MVLLRHRRLTPYRTELPVPRGREAGIGWGCGPGSEQYRWLQADLAAHKNACTLAYWHYPDSPQVSTAPRCRWRISGMNWSLRRSMLPSSPQPYLRALRLHRAHGCAEAHRARLRFDHRNAKGDPQGIQQFVVGTGGRNHVRFKKPPLVGEVVRDDTSFGVLSMTLKAGSYDWEFVPVKGSTFRDRGSAKCR